MKIFLVLNVLMFYLLEAYVLMIYNVENVYESLENDYNMSDNNN